MKKLLFSLVLILSATTARADAFNIHAVQRYADVLDHVADIRADILSGGITPTEWIALRNAMYLLAELRTTLNPTGQGEDIEFQSGYFGLIHDAFGSSSSYEQYLGAAYEAGQPILDEGSTIELLSQWPIHRDAFKAALAEAGIVAEADGARMLAALVYAANITGMKNGESALATIQDYQPGWLWPLAPLPED